MNTYLKYQSPVIHFFSFLAFAGGFFLLNSIISAFFFKDLNEIILNKNAVFSPEIISRFKWAQFISATISFLLPALLFSYYSSPKALTYVGIQRSFSPFILVLCVIMLFSIQPFITYIGQLNEHIHFGSFQNYMKQMEELYERAMKAFLQMHSFSDLLVNLFLMALMPAISEELFFRGAFQKVLFRLSHKPWLAILSSSLVFALLHGTLLKIIPIFVLGLLLGTVYHLTRNIWYNIVIHLINNSLALLAYYYSDRSSLMKKISDDTTTFPFYIVLLSIALTVFFLISIAKKGEAVLPRAMTDEENDFIA